MRVILNSNAEYVNEIRQKLKDNDNYCPCQIEKSPDTKCMCKDFRNMMDNQIEGECHCGLYKLIMD